MIRRHGAEVRERVLIRRERYLPLPGEVLVKRGQEVSPDTLVAKSEVLPGEPYVVDLNADFHKRLTPEEVDRAALKRVGDRVTIHEVIARMVKGAFADVLVVKSPVNGTVEFISRAYGRVLIREDPRSALPMAIIPVAKQLQVWPGSLRMYLTVREGAEVRQGGVVAAMPSALGTLEYVYSPISGLVEKVCSRSGTVTIVRPARPTMLDAYIAGTVTDLIPERGAVIETKGAYVQGIFGLGGEHHGLLSVVARGPGEPLTDGMITEAHAGKVLVGGSHVPLAALRKALAVGAVGVVAGGADVADLSDLIGQPIGVAVTGQEDLDLTLLITEGFGSMPMAAPTFALLQRHDGAVVSINGATQVRAGVVRPELIIPGADGSESGPLDPEAEHQLAVGMRVRVVRKPYFGLWGTVTGLPTEPVAMETEARLKAVELELEDGQRVMVPEANIELA